MAKTKAATNPAIRACIDAFHDGFVRRFGFKPVINGGKDATLLKKLIATWGEAEVLALIGRFFETTEPRVIRSDYSVGAFAACAQSLKIGKRPDARTSDNLDAAARAMGRDK